MKTSARWLLAMPWLVMVAACNGSGGGPVPPSPVPPPPPPPPPPPTMAGTPGGVWEGVDGIGVDIIVLATESGRFQYVNEFLDQGSGDLSVGGNSISADFEMVTAFGATFADGTTRASCSLSGSLAERQSMTVTIDCTTTAGRQSQSTATLSYDPVYERDSDLSVIAGNYDDAGRVLDIDANGVLFEQDPASGCITNGQVSIIDAAFNAYAIEFGYSSCSGNATALNGTTFAGMALLDNTVSPESLIIGVIGEVAGERTSLFGIAQRL